MKARRRLIIPIAVVAIGMGVWILWPRNNNLTGSIQASGTIEATQVGVAPKIAGRVMKISVQEGQQVEAGQVVAELDAAEVDAQARQAQAAVDAARTRPAQADASVTLARASVVAVSLKKRAQIESALAVLEANKANLAAAEANLQAIETNLARAESDLARWEALYREGAVSAEQIDTARSAAKALRAQRDAARAQRDAAQIQLGAAGAGVAQAQALLQQAEILRSYTILKAPMAGVVVAKNAEVGDLVGVGAPVVTVADLSQVYLRVFVSESDFARVKLGQPVDVRVDGFSGRTFRGTVDQINSSAEFTPRNVQTKEERVKLIFGVKVALPNPDGVLKPGLPADAVILVVPAVTP